jgi:nucleoid-associated protein YgaU
MGQDDLDKEMADLRKQQKGATPAPKAYMAEHTVVAGDSMSGIAQQYYGSGVKEKWMAIYEANKDVMGDNPTLIHPGQVLKIPKLDD